jgi:hypothetical protein
MIYSLPLMSCGSTALGTLSLANRVADMKAYSSVKRRQGDGQLIAGPAHYLIWASTVPGYLTFEVWSG